MQPYEIVGVPFTLWCAPVGTAFPLIGVAPAADWKMIGTHGDRSQDEEGVTVSSSQTINAVRTAGATAPVKAFRTEEGLVISLTLLDISLEQYSLALNSNAVATTAAGAGTAGFKAVKLYRGVEVATMALLVRGDASAYGDNMKCQYEVPVCYQSGNPEPVHTKGQPAGLALEFTALEDFAAATPDMRFGRLVMQHQAPLAGP